MCDKRNVKVIKNVKGKIELKEFNGYIEKNKKQIPQYLHFKCGMNHLNYSPKKLGKTFKLQKELLKTEMDHDEVDYNYYKDKKVNGYLMSKITFSVLLLVMLGIVKQWKK